MPIRCDRRGVLLADLNLDGMVTSEDLDGLTYQGSGVSYFEGDVDLDDDFDSSDLVRIFVEIDENAQAIPMQANPPRQLDLKLYSPTTSPTLQPVTYPSSEFNVPALAPQIEVDGPVMTPVELNVYDPISPIVEFFELEVGDLREIGISQSDYIADPFRGFYHLEADSTYPFSVSHVGHEGPSSVDVKWKAILNAGGSNFDESRGVGALYYDPNDILHDPYGVPPGSNGLLYLPTVEITFPESDSIGNIDVVTMLNVDDDDEDGILDKFDSYVAGGDDDLIKMVVSEVSIAALHSFAGHTTLTFDSEFFRVFQTANRTGELFSGANLSHNSDTTLYLEPKKNLPAFEPYSEITATYYPDNLSSDYDYGPVAYRTVKATIFEIDADVDANNDLAINDSDEYVEDANPMTVGKGARVFINRDDDNENGKADATEAGTVSGENDLAAIVVRFKAPGGVALNGYQLRLKIEAPGIKLYANSSRQALVAPGGTLTSLNGTEKWGIWDPATFNSPKTFYAEGTEVGKYKIHWRLYDPNGKIVNSDATGNGGVRDTVQVHVENLVWPLKTQASATWYNLESKDWRGVQLPEDDPDNLGWYIDKRLVDYIVQGRAANSTTLTTANQGTIETIHPDADGPETPSVACSDSSPPAAERLWACKDGKDAIFTQSVVDSLDNGFVLEFNYDFETARNDPYGYIQANAYSGGSLRTKLSFVGNSGIKFGAHEAAIIDTQSWVAMAGGINAIEPHIQADGKLFMPGYNPEPSDPTTNFEK